jgi:hypothetical protein
MAVEARWFERVDTTHPLMVWLVNRALGRTTTDD